MASDKGKKDGVRVWCGGSFDILHYGHSNALRQAKSMGDYLVAGVHSDAVIALNKGPPVFNEQDRYKMVRAIKWVDEVVEDVPFRNSLEILDRHGCELCVHGDDVSMTTDGEDTFRETKAANRYREFKRTQGVSTTDLVGRMLLLTRTHHRASFDSPDLVQMETGPSATPSPWTGVSHFLSTTSKIQQFSSGLEPKPGDRIIYASGAFDVFHVGHLDFLEKASKEGDYLIVGLHSDKVVNRYKGSNHPIMNIHERTLSLLAYRYVSEVVIDAPYKVSKEMMQHFKIDLVVNGSEDAPPAEDGSDPYQEPKRVGKFKVIHSGNDMSTTKIIERILRNRETFENRNKLKEAKEIALFHLLQSSQNSLDTKEIINLDMTQFS